MTNMTIGKKLGIAVAAAVASLLVLSFAALQVISMLGLSLDHAVNTTGRKLELVGETRQAFQDLKTKSIRGQVAYAIVSLEKKAGGDAEGSCSMCHAPASMADSIREIQASGDLVKQHDAELRKLVSDQESRKALDAFQDGASRWVEYSREYLQLANADKFTEAHAVLQDKMFPILEVVESSASVLAKKESEALAATNREAQGQIAGGRWVIFTIILFNMFVGAAVFWLVFRITGALRNIVGEMSFGAEQLAAAAGQLASTGQTLTKGATEQAASLEQTSASSVQINSIAKSNTANSSKAAALATDSGQHFTEAIRALDELVGAMAEINESSGKISQIIRVVDDVAFQTNILALNAAVEAARAGEAGLGFAVVADEVRRLAQRCAQAAEDTSHLIEESVGKAQRGKSKVDRVAAVIHTISEHSAEISTLVKQVQAGSSDQTRGIEEVSRALSMIEQVTQQTAAAAEENAAAGEQLSSQSESLRAIVGKLNAMVDSSAAAMAR